MSYERWLKDRLIKKQAPDHDQINNQLFRFDRMRRKRHDFIYGSEDHTTEREALAAIRTAQDLIRRIEECLGDEYFKRTKSV